MKCFLACAILLCAIVASTKALECWHCENANSIEECDFNGRLIQCRSNQESCEATVRRRGKSLQIWKSCKQELACRNSMIENDKTSDKSTQCNSDDVDSECHCCCNDDKCNHGEPTCFDFSSQQSFQTENFDVCQRQSEVFPHGRVSCSGANEGAVCKYECTNANYSVFPAGSETQTCRKDGSWSLEKPCCARPCPPFLLYDRVNLIHTTEADRSMLMKVFELGSGVLGAESGQEAVMYFGRAPNETTRIDFNQYNRNFSLIQKLIRDKWENIVNDGEVNTGAAIRYAVDNMFTVEAGMREHPRVAKFLLVLADRQPQDDAIAAADFARTKGILVLFIAVNTPNSNFAQEELLEIVGNNPNHLFLVDELTPVTFAPIHAEYFKHACQDPCVHALHDHPGPVWEYAPL